jgi:hypothetical protein
MQYFKKHLAINVNSLFMIFWLKVAFLSVFLIGAITIVTLSLHVFHTKMGGLTTSNCHMRNLGSSLMESKTHNIFSRFFLNIYYLFAMLDFDSRSMVFNYPLYFVDYS